MVRLTLDCAPFLNYISVVSLLKLVIFELENRGKIREALFFLSLNMFLN